MNVVELLDKYPGPEYLHEHAKAVIRYADITLDWVFVNKQKIGSLPQLFEGVRSTTGISRQFNSFFFERPALQPVNKLASVDNRSKLALLKHFERLAPDRLHFQNGNVAVGYWWLAKALGVPFTFSLRGSDVQVYTKAVPGFIAALQDAYTQAYAVHAVCEEIKEEFVSLLRVQQPAKIQVIRTVLGSGWDTVDRGAPESDLLFCIGHLRWRKGYPDLLRAIRLLKDQGMICRVAIAGEGPDRTLLEYMIRDLDLVGQIALLGVQNHGQIREYLQKAAFLVHPAIQEGFPNALAEGMAAGVPIIATRSNGIPELLEEGKNAYLVDIGDPQGLARQIARAMHGAIDVDSMVQLNRTLANTHFSPEVHAAGFARLWNATHLK